MYSAPWTRTPAVAWWQLWPGSSGGNGSSPSVGYPIARRQFLAVPVLTRTVIAAGASVEGFCHLVESNWIYRVQAFAMTANKDIRVTVTDVASGRILVRNASPFAFVGGLPGKSWAQFSYILGERQILKFDFTNAGAAPVTMDCCVLGQYERGVL